MCGLFSSEKKPDPTESDGDETELLINKLVEREDSLELLGRYEQPTSSSVGVPTAVFPINVYQGDKQYGRTTKEFRIPERGLSDTDAALTKFLARKLDKKPENISPSDVKNIIGHEVRMELDGNGDLVEVSALTEETKVETEQ